MNPNAFGILMLLFSLISGGGANRDALDLMNTDTYWRVKGVQVTVEQLRHDAAGESATVDAGKLVKALSSADFQERDAAKTRLKAAGPAALDALKTAAESKDAEVAAAASELIDQISSHLKELKIRQRMAIRTLGEHQEKSALDVLQALTASKEPFVATYSQRAIAAINGQTLAAVDHRADLAPDLAILPAECGIVGQTTGLGTPNLTIDVAVEKALAGVQPGDVPQLQPDQKPAVPDKQKTIDELTKQLLFYVEQIGDLRADGITLGISKDLGERGGWVVISFRGDYDSQATIDMLKRLVATQNHNSDEGATLYKAGGINAFQLEDAVTLLFPSDHQLIFIVADGRRSPAAEAVVPVVLGLLTGKGGLEESSELAGLVKSADKSGAAWVAGIANESLAQEIPAIAPVQSAVITAKAAKDGFDLTLTAKTNVSADENIGLAGTVNIGMIAVLTEAQREVERTPEMASVVDFLKSVKAAATPTGGTITATIPNTIGQALITSMRYDLLYLMARDEQPAQPNGMNGGMNGPPILP